jgi:predicted ATPase with chaperone activity
MADLFSSSMSAILIATATAHRDRDVSLTRSRLKIAAPFVAKHVLRSADALVGKTIQTPQSKIILAIFKFLRFHILLFKSKIKN